MYHCCVHFYLLGDRSEIFEIIKEMPPLEHFTHEFWESGEVDEALAAKANVILADLRDPEMKNAADRIVSSKNKEAELILIADKEQTGLLSGILPEVKDIWISPMTEEEIKFRFLRWQQTYKMSKDFWQTNHFFEATINHIPNLIWYKDKNGIHEKVNDSFCQTVISPNIR